VPIEKLKKVDELELEEHLNQGKRRPFAPVVIQTFLNL
jgi:hypothetical protein